MMPDYHIFISREDRVVTVKREGMDESMDFPSLAEAIRKLRDECMGFVVIHEEGGRSANRIPLQF